MITMTKIKLKMLLPLLLYLSSLCLFLQIVNSQPWTPDLQKLLKLHNKLRHDLMECKVPGQPPAKYLPDLMAWENTTHVGCGIKDCRGTSFGFGLSIVCNYGEGGNYPGRYPYTSKPASECGKTPVPIKTTPRPAVIRTSQKPPVTKKLPKPDWTTLISTWSQYATTQQLKGTVTQTCICIN
ncbi:unnamed protein product [Trichobilharzia szidati]|nr:unnamed protein product [Trichobilharzia szidati]